MADVREKVEQIRQAVYGKEVRESIASGIEAINTEVESTTQRQTTLETDMAEAKREAEAMAIWEEYDPDNDYAPLNKVAYQGSSYINVLACKGVPPTEETHWLPIASKGDKGELGPMPTLVIGNTTTLSPGSPATVTRRASSPDAAPVLDFGIPRGIDGTGSGDMAKVVYDTNDDGKVNAADIADAVPTGAITDVMLSNDPNHIKARLSSHMAESASKHITESGSNANGSYIKFDDGTMICYSRKSLKKSDDTRIATGDVLNTAFTAPAAFVGDFTANISAHGYGGGTYSENDVSFIKVAPLAGYVRVNKLSTATPIYTIPVYAHMIGRWK